MVRSMLVDLVLWLWQEHGISVSPQTLGCELQTMGYRKPTARPRHHAQDSQAIEEFEIISLPLWQKLPPKHPEENK